MESVLQVATCREMRLTILGALIALAVPAPNVAVIPRVDHRQARGSGCFRWEWGTGLKRRRRASNALPQLARESGRVEASLKASVGVAIDHQTVRLGQALGR